MDRRSEETAVASDQLTSVDHHTSQVSLDRSVIETASLMSLDQIGVGGDSSLPETKPAATTHPSLALNEKVASLASSIYTELEKIVKLYGRDTVKELMSIVVNVLEALDSAIQEKEELLAENELVRDDYEKLLMQYEREKQSRKEAESKLFQSEDLVEAQKNKYEEKIKEMQMLVTTIDLKARNTSDQLVRLEEKENECKKEYNKLHERYTELFKTHWDYLDRTKILFGHENPTTAARSGAKSNISNTTNNTNSTVVSNTSGVSSNVTSSGQLSNTSRQLFDMIKTGSNVINRDELINALRACSKSDLHNVVGLLSQDSGSGEVSTSTTSNQTLTNNPSSSSSLASLESSSKQSGPNEPQQAGEAKLITSDTLPESVLSRHESAAVDKLNSDNFDEQLNNVEFDDDAASDIQTKNSEIEFEGEEMNIGPNDITLYKEMDARGDIIDDQDDGADLTGMSREVANLIRENSELMQTKHALNVVKDDLIVKLDNFSSEMVILNAEIRSLQTVKTALQQRITQLEEEAKIAKEELAAKTRKIEEEDENVPMSQRKRFTRAEMARVIMERNQYKERLIDLQDAVRWTEMIRANKASEQVNAAGPSGAAADSATTSEASKKEEQDHKKRSTVWKFFSDLFSSQSQHQPNQSAGSSLSPSSTSNNLSPKSNKRAQQSKVAAMSPSSSIGSPVQVVPGGLDPEKNEKITKAYEFLKEDKTKLSASPAKNSTELTAGTLASTAHRADEGRVQAYGWSLPSLSGKAKTAESGAFNLTVPVPVFCRPLFEEDNNLKMSCATPVNYEFDAQVTADCSRFIQSSPYNSFQSNDEIKSSCVWVCSFDENDTHVSVFDANKPDNLLSQFTLKSLKVHCSLGVPGANKSQLPLDDQRPSISNRKPLNNETIKAGTEANQYPDDLDSITYIECEANEDDKSAAPLDSTDNKQNESSSFSPYQKTGRKVRSRVRSLSQQHDHQIVPNAGTTGKVQVSPASSSAVTSKPVMLSTYMLNLIEFNNFVMRVKKQIMLFYLLIVTVIELVKLPVLFFFSLISDGNISYTEDCSKVRKVDSPPIVNSSFVTELKTRRRRKKSSRVFDSLSDCERDDHQEDHRYQGLAKVELLRLNQTFIMNNLMPPFPHLESPTRRRFERKVSFSCKLTSRQEVEEEIVCDLAVANDHHADQAESKSQETLSTAYPTVWLGSQEGLLLVHSSISNVNVTLDKIKLKDAILCISHNNGKVIVGLADGSVAIFYRSKSGQWDLKNYYLISFDNLHHSIRCLNNVYEHVWCGCRNKIYIVDPTELNVPAVIEVHPKKENQVRHMAWVNDGVWVSIRLDTTLRLYHAKTRQHLQYLDIEPFITRMLGTSNLGLSLVRISSLMIASKRLWIGTGNGVVLSIPFTDSGRKSSLTGASLPGSIIRVSKSEEPLSSAAAASAQTQDAKIPFCNLIDAQFSFHGHRDAVKFFLNVPTMTLNKAVPGQKHERTETTLVVSGGHGYIDFRIGDVSAANAMAGRSGASLERKLHELSKLNDQQQQQQPADSMVNKNDQSRLIVWEIKDHL